MDVSSVHHNSTLLRYSVSLLGYGFYGDVIKDSERKRWMGLARYDFSGESGRHAMWTLPSVLQTPSDFTHKAPLPRMGGSGAVTQICSWDPNLSHLTPRGGIWKVR